MKCKDCLYWDNKETYNSIPPELKEKYGMCSNNGFIYEWLEDSDRTDFLVYSDYEGYSAGFDTGCDFGCIHWVKK